MLGPSAIGSTSDQLPGHDRVQPRLDGIVCAVRETLLENPKAIYLSERTVVRTDA
jgi:hypothetical protein